MYSGEHIGSPLQKTIHHKPYIITYGKQINLGKNPEHRHYYPNCRSNHFRYHVLYRRIIKKREDEIRFILSVYKAISNFPFLSILHW